VIEGARKNVCKHCKKLCQPTSGGKPVHQIQNFFFTNHLHNEQDDGSEPTESSALAVALHAEVELAKRQN
jgi:hypothetical protein